MAPRIELSLNSLGSLRSKAQKTCSKGTKWNRSPPEGSKQQGTPSARLLELTRPTRREARPAWSPSDACSPMAAHHPHPRQPGTSSHSPAVPSRATVGTPVGRGGRPASTTAFPSKKIGNHPRLSGLQVDDEGHLRCPWRNPCGRRQNTNSAGSSRPRSCLIVRHPPSLGIPDSCTLEPTSTLDLLLASFLAGSWPHPWAYFWSC